MQCSTALEKRGTSRSLKNELVSFRLQKSTLAYVRLTHISERLEKYLLAKPPPLDMKHVAL